MQLCGKSIGLKVHTPRFFSARQSYLPANLSQSVHRRTLHKLNLRCVQRDQKNEGKVEWHVVCKSRDLFFLRIFYEFFQFLSIQIILDFGFIISHFGFPDFHNNDTGYVNEMFFNPNAEVVIVIVLKCK